jgi:hypothetical protein
MGAGCVVVSLQLIIGIGAVCIVRRCPRRGLQQLLHYTNSARPAGDIWGSCVTASGGRGDVFDSRAFTRSVFIAYGGLGIPSGAIGGVIVDGNQGKGHWHWRGQRSDWGQGGDEKSGEGGGVHGNEERSGDERHRRLICTRY